MKKVLVDTSVWIDALNGRNTYQTSLLNQLIDDDANIVVCPTIVQEILQGIKEDKDFNLVKDTLTGFEVLYADPLDAAHGAALLYRNARKHGITIRKSNDCLIAYYCISCKASILHNDDDFNKIAKYSTLKVFESL